MLSVKYIGIIINRNGSICPVHTVHPKSKFNRSANFFMWSSEQLYAVELNITFYLVHPKRRVYLEPDLCVNESKVI